MFTILIQNRENRLQLAYKTTSLYFVAVEMTVQTYQALCSGRFSKIGGTRAPNGG